MKKISEHLGQIIIALCGVALLIAAVVVFRAPIGNFFNSIVSKETTAGDTLLAGVSDPDFSIDVDYEKPVITFNQDLSENSNDPTPVAGSVSNGTYTLSGKVTDAFGVQSLTVNGTEVTVAAGGTWSTAISIAQNETKGLVIVATDSAGNKATKTVYIANISYVNFEVTSSNRSKVGYNGAGNEELVIPATFYDEEDSKWYKVTSIGAGAFLNCTNLTSVVIPNGITSIGYQAFYGCTNLTSVVIPNGITSIGDYAFYGCTNLALTSLPSSLTSIGINAFMDCTNLALTELPSGITSIGDGAFTGCTNLTSVTIPEGITSIGAGAFSECTNLALISLPSGLTSIGNLAFVSCTNLTSVTIPESVTSIGDFTFHSCTNLATITFDGTMSQWNTISLGTKWKSGVPATQVVCSDGIVSL